MLCTEANICQDISAFPPENKSCQLQTSKERVAHSKEEEKAAWMPMPAPSPYS